MRASLRRRRDRERLRAALSRDDETAIAASAARGRVRRVLMISPHFPPDSTAATHRVRLLAPHLAEYGWTPTVLTVDQAGEEGANDHDLAALVPANLDVARTRAWPAALTRLVGIGDLGLRAVPGLARSS